MKSVRWGMIGHGDVTEVKSGPGLYKADRSSLVSVAGRSLEKARDWAARHNGARVCDTPEDLLADPEIDIVYIATPPSTHMAYTLMTARAGKHVCVEKPMAMDEAECREMIAACEAAGVRLYVAFYRRSMPRFVQVKQWIDSGVIGEVRTVHAVQHQCAAQSDTDSGNLPWRVRGEIAGGGKFVDMGVHELDFFDFLFGPIEEAHGLAANLGGLYEVEDTVNAVWRHVNGVQGSGSWCYVCGRGEDRVEITGSRGSIEFEFFNDTPLVLTDEHGTRQVSIPNPDHVHQPFFQSIVDELLGRGTCPGDADAAARTSRVAGQLLSGYRTARSGVIGRSGQAAGPVRQ